MNISLTDTTCSANPLAVYTTTAPQQWMQHLVSLDQIPTVGSAVELVGNTIFPYIEPYGYNLINTVEAAGHSILGVDAATLQLYQTGSISITGLSGQAMAAIVHYKNRERCLEATTNNHPEWRALCTNQTLPAVVLTDATTLASYGLLKPVYRSVSSWVPNLLSGVCEWALTHIAPGRLRHTTKGACMGFGAVALGTATARDGIAGAIRTGVDLALVTGGVRQAIQTPSLAQKALYATATAYEAAGVVQHLNSDLQADDYPYSIETTVAATACLHYVADGKRESFFN